ncbi:MAG: citramalate synthase [Candidatus Margulisbacteria bacterium]|nr:citramalate synthase [Candidatus Margulisiibacteriota bacterium]
MQVKIFDTTLRDGEQGEGISFTVSDKIKIAKLLDDIGVHYIEGGWPGSNPKAVDFFDAMCEVKLKRAKVVAFGSTKRHGVLASEDANLKAIVSSGVRVACIFGKTWDFHVTHALKISLEENLTLITDSIRFLKEKMDEVFFDAEHFFDGYKKNPEYAIKCLQAAEAGGVDVLVLADTNGGTLTHEVEEIMNVVKNKVKVPLGIHAHNDSELAVANSLTAVHCGAVQVQGTINGYGERAGNANLCSIIPALKLKMKIACISDEELATLTKVSRHISEIANLPHNNHFAYVGKSAFAHKGGIHVSAINKYSETYEHIKPELVGNKQRVLISELSGVSNLKYKAEKIGINLDGTEQAVKDLLKDIKELEKIGYQFEEGEATFELMLKRATGQHTSFFELVSLRVINDRFGEDDYHLVEATVKLKVNGKVIHTAGEGSGPVGALDHALRKAIEGSFPEIKTMRLVDYRVRVLNSTDGTDAKVRVVIASQDDNETWGTVGVSANIIEASWFALVDSIEYKLLKERQK